MNARRLYRAAGLATFLSFATGCGDGRVSGGGDEMGNFVRVALVDSTGAPVVGAHVAARALDERIEAGDPTQVISTSSGPDGVAVLHDLPAGRWMLVARASGIGRADSLVLAADQREVAATLALAPLGSLSGRLEPRPSERTSWVRLPGRGIVVATDSLGFFRLDSVEPGPALVLAGGGDDTLARQVTEIAPGAVRELGALPASWTGWTWEKSLWIHTGALGVAITSVVTDLPVPLRLAAADVDFTKLGSDFADLRITKADGTPLPLSIEQWDGRSRTLTAWVLVDTIRPDVDSQRLVVRGGNPAAGATWARPFAPAQGWIGVWHMGADLSDQTGQGRDGENHDAFLAGGPIGEAHWFKRDTASHILVHGGESLDAVPDGDLLVEAWARLDVASVEGFDAIVTRNDAGYRLQRDGTTSGISFAVIDSALATDGSLGSVKVSGTTDIADGQWHHFVGMRRGDSLLVFVDGRREGAVPYSGRTRRATVPLGIGVNGSGRHWHGMIDEVRVGRTARSDDWVRLSFEAQSPTGRLVAR